MHMAQLMPLPLTVSCFSKIQTGFTFLVPAHPGCPRQRAVKQVCVTGLRMHTCLARYRTNARYPDGEGMVLVFWFLSSLILKSVRNRFPSTETQHCRCCMPQPVPHTWTVTGLCGAGSGLRFQRFLPAAVFRPSSLSCW